ncbi:MULTISPECIES: hypothetical protein [unclassified Streptomyces]|uniref:hypothetical protein n=1 Tax=unclassified Streptomyces TaxID=2593676 RepID=UPI002966481E|nr:hypothetical protein [Streptomyces sp. SJL17-1]
MRVRPAFLPVRALFAAPLLAVLPLLLPGTAPVARGATDPVSACALDGATGWTDEGHDTDWSVFERPSGTVRVGMIFVDFPDAPATEAPADVAAQLTPGAD